ncbi:hypothetical protein GCM10027160_35220 [Streptomyces calidiresistens]
MGGGPADIQKASTSVGLLSHPFPPSHRRPAGAFREGLRGRHRPPRGRRRPASGGARGEWGTGAFGALPRGARRLPRDRPPRGEGTRGNAGHPTRDGARHREGPGVPKPARGRHGGKGGRGKGRRGIGAEGGKGGGRGGGKRGDTTGTGRDMTGNTG